MIVIKTKLKEMPKSCAQCYAEYDTGCPHLTCYDEMPRCDSKPYDCPLMEVEVPDDISNKTT